MTTCALDANAAASPTVPVTNSALMETQQQLADDSYSLVELGRIEEKTSTNVHRAKVSVHVIVDVFCTTTSAVI